MAGVVNEGGQQVVRRGNRVEVSGEMQVDGFHRKYLGITAAGGAALHAEDGAQGGFAQGENGFFPEAVHPLSQGNRSRRFAGTGGHAGRSRDEDEFTVGFLAGSEFDLGFVAAVGLEFGVREAPFVGEVVDALKLCSLSNFDIREHENSS